MLGCSGDSPEKRELIDWATIADAYEHSVHSKDNCSRRLLARLPPGEPAPMRCRPGAQASAAASIASVSASERPK